MNKYDIHDWICVDNIFYIGGLFVLDHGDKLSEKFFKLEITVKISLWFSLGCEEYLELVVEDHMDEVVHKTCVEAILGLGLEGDPQQLQVKYPDVGVGIILEDFQYAVSTL